MNYLQSSKIIFVPLPEEEFGHLTKQRDKLTGNTKSGKKKLKNAQEKYLLSRESQLKKLLRKANIDQEEISAELEKSPSPDVYDW